MLTLAVPPAMTKKPTPPLPSSVIVSPARNVRSFMDRAICFSSRLSRSEKSGTRLISSTGASAMALSIEHRGCEDTEREADRRGLLARLAQPGRRTIRLSRQRVGQPVARLRARCARASPRAGPVAARGRDRDHALPPRPLGRPRAVGVGLDVSPGARGRAAARRADLFVCEATLLRGELDGEPRGHLALDETLAAFEASGAKRLLVTHRPAELPSDGKYEFAYDGLEVEVD